MKQEIILNKLKKVLINNSYVKEAIKSNNETAKKLSHWETYEINSYVDSICFCWTSGEVILSNEGDISLTDETYNTEFLFDLNEEFQKEGLFVEAYDEGTFMVSYDSELKRGVQE